MGGFCWGLSAIVLNVSGRAISSSNLKLQIFGFVHFLSSNKSLSPHKSSNDGIALPSTLVKNVLAQLCQKPNLPNLENSLAKIFTCPCQTYFGPQPPAIGSKGLACWLTGVLWPCDINHLPFCFTTTNESLVSPPGCTVSPDGV